jgi:hypothetical protein
VRTIDTHWHNAMRSLIKWRMGTSLFFTEYLTSFLKDRGGALEGCGLAGSSPQSSSSMLAYHTHDTIHIQFYSLCGSQGI